MKFLLKRTLYTLRVLIFANFAIFEKLKKQGIGLQTFKGKLIRGN